MKKEKNIVDIDDKELPVDKYKDAELKYDYHVRTKGGFVDAMFLSAIIITFAMWMFIFISLGGK